ncbi:hypothetical protein FHX37_2343 [Haloactinospora alba]|uniref:Uncharacterized protein n=1 Tax=Haloactinospora alba TaxID=405555 RepID=A0A543NKP3_9ACTN|nr:hypothetical protein FHX37_2343 [Haloactinospora alba]
MRSPGRFGDGEPAGESGGTYSTWVTSRAAPVEAEVAMAA